MALETLLIKVKTTLSNPKLLKKPSFKSTTKRRRILGVLAFEIAALMSKLLHLSQSLSDSSIIRLRNDAVSLLGVQKLVSHDESFLLRLASAEFVDSLRLLADSVSRLCLNCHDPTLRSFHSLLRGFADSGRDPHRWALSGPKEIEANHRKMERYVTITASLHREMEELTNLESALRRTLHHDGKEQKKGIELLQQKISWRKQEIRDLKEKSLWNRSFDSVVSLLVRSIFTVVARIKLVFVIRNSVTLSRSLSSSAAIHPSDSSSSCKFVSGPLKDADSISNSDSDSTRSGFFESNCKLLIPNPSTLGFSALALHYANLIIVMEKMIKSPQLIGMEARDDLYAMLPNSIRSSLRRRLRGIGICSASDGVLAGEWREAMGRILGWLSPLAHNMIKWQSERSFEQKNCLVTKNVINNVLLLQTLFFADKEKTEAAITELLVGLNYVWRFEREMTAKALFQCVNLNVNNGVLNLQHKPC